MKQAARIYADHAASSPLVPAAAEAIAKAIAASQGNPSSQHLEGRIMRAVIDEARASLAEWFGCSFGEVIFTSSGTEAAQLAMVGTALGSVDQKRTRIIIPASEHHCVIHQAKLLARLGFEAVFAPVDRYARLDLAWLEANLDDTVLLVCLMHANNEFGTWQDVRAAAALAHHAGALLFSDCVQTLGVDDPNIGFWTPETLGADLVSVSAHKIGGPKGVGALYVKAGTKIEPVLLGGGQEREMRAGTESVAAIAGFGAAVRSLENAPVHGVAARAFESSLNQDLFTLTVPDRAIRHPEIVHARIPGVKAEAAVIRLDRAGLAIGSGAACSSGSLEPSHVMEAAGYTHAEAKEGLRFSFSRHQTAEEGAAAALTANEVLKGLGHAR